MNQLPQPRVAVIIPCYNEGLTIRTLVQRFQQFLPNALIYVYDNNSKDNTSDEARAAGAIVRLETQQGKGNVIRRMFADVDADIYVMVDGDSTYDPKDAPRLVALLQENGLDMVVGAREAQSDSAFPSGHAFGNRLFNIIVQHIFGRGFKDVFSGYRIFSRRYVKSFPAHSARFETETEMCIHALDLRIPFMEAPIDYGVRPEGSVSKLNTYRDGFRILMTIFMMFKDVRPMMFFALLGGFFALAALVLGIPVIAFWYENGVVNRQPTALLCTGLILLSGMAFTCGVLLDSVARSCREAKRLAYLQL